MHDLSLTLPEIDRLYKRWESINAQLIGFLMSGMMGKPLQEDDVDAVGALYMYRQNPDLPAAGHPASALLLELPFAAEGLADNGEPKKVLTLVLPNAAQYVPKEKRSIVPQIHDVALTLVFDPSQPAEQCVSLQMHDPLHLFGIHRMTALQMHHEEYHVQQGTSVICNLCDKEQVVQCAPDKALNLLSQISGMLKGYMEELDTSPKIKALIALPEAQKLYVCCDRKDASTIIFAGQTTGHAVEPITDGELYMLTKAKIPGATAGRYVEAVSNLEQARAIYAFTPRQYEAVLDVPRSAQKLLGRGFINEQIVKEAQIACDIPPRDEPQLGR